MLGAVEVPLSFSLRLRLFFFYHCFGSCPFFFFPEGLTPRVVEAPWQRGVTSLFIVSLFFFFFLPPIWFVWLKKVHLQKKKRAWGASSTLFSYIYRYSFSFFALFFFCYLLYYYYVYECDWLYSSGAVFFFPPFICYYCLRWPPKVWLFVEMQYATFLSYGEGDTAEASERGRDSRQVEGCALPELSSLLLLYVCF